MQLPRTGRFVTNWLALVWVGILYSSVGSPGDRETDRSMGYSKGREEQQAERRSNGASVLLVGALMCLSGCDDKPLPPFSTCCDASSEPVFLHTKLDDDDGDGNPYDEQPGVINDEDDDIADHSWIRDAQGVFHLFFQNEGVGSGRSSIEHYSSPDLVRLDYVGVALSPNPLGWESFGLWAPHVVERDGVYFMFYTGVDGRGANASQRIGLATSTDLVHWTRRPINNCPETSGDGCVYTCDESWTAWSGGPVAYNHQCRDPFVIWDADGASWVLFATAKSLNQYAMITVARSADLDHWTGEGYLDATRRLENGVGAQATGGQAENAQVFAHQGTFYLLFSDWWDTEDADSVASPRTMVQYATSTTLRADAAGSPHWVYRGSIPDPGVNAVEALQVDPATLVLSQSISNERSRHYPSRARQLRLKCVVWEAGLKFDTLPYGGVCDRSKQRRFPIAP